MLTLVITKICSQKEWFQSETLFTGFDREKNIVFGLTFVSHPVKKFPDTYYRQGIKWDIFLIFFDIRNPRLLLSHLHENFREKWFLEKKMYRLLQLLLGSDVGGVSAFLLTTIGGSGMKTSITFTANHFVGIVFLGQKSQGWFNDTTTKSQHQMKSRFCKK